MKNFICLALCLGFLNLAAPAFAWQRVEKPLRKVTRNLLIAEALRDLKESPAKITYRRILGNNNTQRPIKIKFKNLSRINEKYTNYEMISKVKRKRAYIYINKKHKNAPSELLAASIAGLSVHDDKKNSVNEETYAWSVEAVLSDYFLKVNPDVVKYDSTITERQAALRQLYAKSPRDAKYIVSTVRKNRGGIKYKWESKDFSYGEYREKMAKLLNVYQEVKTMPAFVPVSDTAPAGQTADNVPQTENVQNENPCTPEDQCIIEQPVTETVPQKPEIDLKLYDIFQSENDTF